MSEYTPVIGLEVHVELATKSKMFCSCSAEYFGSTSNSHCCPVCLGLPGALPVPNKTAIEWCIRLGLALHCTIANESKFDRKNYFYPDLAKGFQISQYDQPLCANGWIDITDPTTKITKRIRIRRVHMEEDTGKLLHETINGPTSPQDGLREVKKRVTLVDFNRSGVPLVEVVTEPDITSGQEAKLYVQKLHQIVRYLEISSADMEKGSMRLEPNISVRQTSTVKPTNQSNFIEEKDLPKYKVEVKNINSFNFVKKAIEFEVDRHIKILKTDKLPVQETRGWDENKGETISQRRKEEANDYRYFPEPDIPPMVWAKEDIDAIKLALPELPNQKAERFEKQYQLPVTDAEQLTAERNIANYFEQAMSFAAVSKISPKTVANWIINKKVDLPTTTPERLVETILAASVVIDVSDEEVKAAIQTVFAANAKAVTDYKAGKVQVLMFLLGMTIKELKGRGDKAKILELLKEALK